MTKFQTKTRTLLLVPDSSFYCFLRSFIKYPYLTHYRLPIPTSTHCRNSSRSIYFASLLSISLRRCRISSSHTSTASASTGAFKLTTRACANSARSASDSINARERSWFNVSVPINIPNMLFTSIIASLLSLDNCQEHLWVCVSKVTNLFKEFTPDCFPLQWSRI